MARKKQTPNPQPEKWFDNKVVLAALAAFFTLLGGFALAYFNGWLSPKTFSAKLEKPTVDTNVLLKDYLEEMNIPASNYSAADLAQVGYRVHFQVQLVGFKGRTCKARWEVFDSDNKARVFPPGWDKVQEPVEMTPEAATDSASPNFWVPPLATNDAFFVRVTIYDDKDVALTYADSEPVKPRPPSPEKDSVKPSPVKS